MVDCAVWLAEGRVCFEAGFSFPLTSVPYLALQEDPSERVAVFCIPCVLVD